MPLLPTRVWLDAAAAIAEGSHLPSALNIVLNSICDAILAHGMLLQRGTNGWVLVASRVTESRAAEWHASISTIGDHKGPLIRLDGLSDTATAVMLTTGAMPATMLVLDGEWTASRESLSTIQTLSFALSAVRERDAMAQLRSALTRVYRTTRRLRPTLGVEQIADRIVKAVVHTLGASRVSLALVDTATDQLILTAAHGVPQWLRNGTIRRDHGVIGQVLQRRRPLLVANAGERCGPGGAVDRYRTASFVVVPLLVGNEAIGVLCATDKHDLSAFDERDCAVLRTLAAGVGGSLLAARTAAERDRIMQAAAIDPLTRLYNRQYLDSRLRQELERSKREDSTFALLIADVDDFKQINDTAGHQGGDRVLHCLGDIIRSAVRSIDVCARYGGDEFIVLMPNTDVQRAQVCAQRIKALASEHCGSHTAGQQATMSVGIAVSAPGDDPTALFARADKALYGAKAAGKNRIQVDAAALVEPQPAAQRELSYVVVADPHPERLPQYTEWLTPFQTGLLVVRDGAEALSTITRFGQPLLLIVDVAAPAMLGEQLVDRVRGTRTRVLAWGASNTIRSRASDDNGVVYLAADASMPAAKQAAQNLLRTHAALDVQGGAARGIGAIDLESLAEQIRARLGPTNIAFYLPTPDGLHFRAASTWYAGAPPSTGTYDLRSIFARVRELRSFVTSGDVRFLADDDSEPTATGRAPGLVALPLMRAGEIYAVACIYEDSGLALRKSAIDAVTAVMSPPARGRPVVEATTAPTNPVTDTAPAAALPSAASATIVESMHSEVNGALTLLERKSGEAVAVRELARARREQRQLSVVLFELGRRTPVGQPTAPSETLEPVVDTFLKAVRQSDLPIRWAANELLLILPGLAGPEARSVAERVRAAMQAGARHSVAVAGGVAEADPAERQFEEVVERARARVAMAVNRGHNRVH